MRTWIDRLKCRLGFHDGEVAALWGPFVTSRCCRCGHEWKWNRY